MSQQPYKLTEVFTLTIDGKPHPEVYTAISTTAKACGISYQVLQRRLSTSNAFKYITKEGTQIIITRATIVKLHKGRKSTFEQKPTNETYTHDDQ
jgi:hypothetical protein